MFQNFIFSLNFESATYIEYQVFTRLIFEFQNFFKKIVFRFEFECASKYPPD